MLTLPKIRYALALNGTAHTPVGSQRSRRVVFRLSQLCCSFLCSGEKKATCFWTEWHLLGIRKGIIGNFRKILFCISRIIKRILPDIRFQFLNLRLFSFCFFRAVVVFVLYNSMSGQPDQPCGESPQVFEFFRLSSFGKCIIFEINLFTYSTCCKRGCYTVTPFTPMRTV